TVASWSPSARSSPAAWSRERRRRGASSTACRRRSWWREGGERPTFRCGVGMVVRRPPPRASSAPSSRPRPMYGPEPWKAVDGEAFTYWDRWILALTANTPDGWAGVRDALKGRGRSWGTPSRGDTEAKLAQVDDISRRLEKAGLTPRTVLGAEARDR